LKKPREGRRCRNCGRPAGPRYCGFCGQALDDRQGPFWPLLKELFAEWLSLDGRLVRSLRALLAPGRLTQLWAGGKRAPYLPPFRLYLLASLAVFSTALALDTLDARDYDVYFGDELVSPQTSGAHRGTLQLLDTKTALGRWTARRYSDRVARLRALPPQEMVDTVFSMMLKSAPPALIAAFPFLALALKLLHWRRKVLYVEHLVFALHLQSALFFALAATWLVARLLSLGLTSSLFAYLAVWLAIMTVYQALALRRFYRQSWWWTAAKVVLVSAAYLQILSYVLGVGMLLALWKV